MDHLAQVKTSVIKALANYFKKDVVILNLALIRYKKTFEESFRDAVDAKRIIVFDELDFVLEGLNELKYREKKPQSFSHLVLCHN